MAPHTGTPSWQKLAELTQDPVLDQILGADVVFGSDIVAIRAILGYLAAVAKAFEGQLAGFYG
jgi:hypothetical protein